MKPWCDRCDAPADDGHPCPMGPRMAPGWSTWVTSQMLGIILVVLLLVALVCTGGGPYR